MSQLARLLKDGFVLAVPGTGARSKIPKASLSWAKISGMAGVYACTPLGRLAR